MLFPKPKKCERLGIIRRKEIERLWPIARDARKREMQRPDGSWICFYCRKPIWNDNECVIAHVVPKGRDAAVKLRKDLLAPSHADCNDTRSKHYKTYTMPEAIEAIAEYLDFISSHHDHA